MQAYSNVALVSSSYILLAYMQMPFGPTAGMTGRSAGHIKWGDRIFMNMMEQSPLFLTSLWTMATMVSPERATTLGWTYLGLRCCYAPLWLVLGGESGAPFPQIFVSTFTQYGINVYQALAVIMKVKYGKDIASYFMGNDLIGAGAVSIGFLMYAVGLTPQINMALSGFFGKVDSKKK